MLNSVGKVEGDNKAGWSLCWTGWAKWQGITKLAGHYARKAVQSGRRYQIVGIVAGDIETGLSLC